MRHITSCTLALLLLPACQDAPPPASTGWIAVDETSWVSLADPTLRVWLSRDADVPGLFIARGDRLLAFETDYGLGPVQLPVLLIGPRADGTPAQAADPSPGLHLLLAGSAEHGCPADDLELDLRAFPEGGRTRLELSISGVPYLALPAEGRISVVDAEGVHDLDAAPHSEGGDLQCDGMELLVSESPALGTVWVAASEPVPWFQVQGHADAPGLIELDMDHSCEDPAWTAAELAVVAWL
ncbi:MAG: hypothetical protein H6742_01130 [Alphaproteobacteria bacterium]|nr:hypothetical protein [Alphaproteobacteria bacterium]